MEVDDMIRLNLKKELFGSYGRTVYSINSLVTLVKKPSIQSEEVKKLFFLLKCKLAQSPNSKWRGLAEFCRKYVGDILAIKQDGKLVFIKASGEYYTDTGDVSVYDILEHSVYVQFECHEEEAWALGRTIVNVQGARTISRLFPIVRVPSFNYEIPPRVGKTADDYVIHSSLLKGG